MRRIALTLLALGAIYIAWHVGLYVLGTTPDEFLGHIRADIDSTIRGMLPDLTRVTSR